MKKPNNKLPKKFKEKWIKALRSGKYKQGQHQLKQIEYGNKQTTYCCLGVACDIVGASRFIDRGLICKGAGIVGMEKIPKLLIGNGDKGEKDYNPMVKKLTEMNDNGRSFKQIASYIQRYL